MLLNRAAVDYEQSPFFLSDSGASETRARVKITPREKGDTLRDAFLAWGDFQAHSRFARSTIPEETWGTTRSLGQRARVDVQRSFHVNSHVT